MAAKRMDLKKRTFLVLSGCSNPLGKSLVLELCRRFASGSLALLIDADPEQPKQLQLDLRKQLEPQIQLLTGALAGDNAEQLLQSALKAAGPNHYELAVLVHNEGEAATQILMEPQTPGEWNDYVQQQLYTPVSLNQCWLQCNALAGMERLVVNVTSSLQLRPLVYSSLLCSCKRARDMYFRAMAAEEARHGVAVLSYAPGLLDTHLTQYDLNGNMVSLADLNVPEQLLKRPRVQPKQATLKLINILEETAFVSGHDVDYYDTFNL